MNIRSNKDVTVMFLHYHIFQFHCPVSTMSNLPLPVHQHVLHSAVKCLPPQHVHSGMPHTVQSPHSVKTNGIMEVKPH